MKKMVLACVIAVLLLALALYRFGYHGPRMFSMDVTSLPAVETVVANARLLKGTPYDPLMGGHGNWGSAAGCMVWSDVPNIAYGLSGYSLESLLKHDFALHPTAYNTAHGNTPGNPYFHRRVRNLYAYFKANGRALPPNAMAAVGDLAFYRDTASSPVSYVTLVTSVSNAGYRVMESDLLTVFAQEVDGNVPMKRGMLLVGFGRMYPPTPSPTP